MLTLPHIKEGLLQLLMSTEQPLLQQMLNVKRILFSEGKTTAYILN